MATFSPQFQPGRDEAPEYLRYSKGISTPQGDQSGAYLGKIGEDVAQGLDTSTKIIGHYAENKAMELGDAAKKAEEDRLDSVEAGLGISTNTNSELKATQFQPTELDGSQSLIQSNKDLPPEIRFGTKTAASLNERFQNGKMSQTDYKSEVDRIAKDLNAQFPAWRSEIAKGLERSTGVAGADAAIQARISNINSILSQLKEKTNKVDSIFYGSLKYIPDQQRAELLRRRSLDPSDPNYLGNTEALYHAGKYEFHEKDNERVLQNLSVREKVRGAVQDDYKDSIAGVVANGMNTFGHNLTVAAGVDTQDQLMEKLRNPNLSTPDKLKLATDFQNNIDALEARLHKDVSPLVSGKGSTGFGEANKQINDALAPLKEWAKQMKDPNNATSPLFAAQHYVNSFKQDLNRIIIDQPQARKLMAAKALDDLNPELIGRINSAILDGEKDFTEKTKGMFGDVVKSTLGISRNDIKNNPPIMKDYMDAADAAKMSPKNQMGFMKFINMMTARGMDDEHSYRIGKAFFDPKNQGLVGRWAMDQYDPRTGKTTEGQVSVLKTLGSEGVAQRVKELSAKHPDLLDDYTNFINNTVKREVFPTLMDDVKNLSVTGSGNRLSFDPTDHRYPFKLTPITPTANDPTAPFTQSGVARQGVKLADRPLQSAVNKLNYVFEVLGRAGTTAGAPDPNVYALRQLLSERPDMFTNEVKGFPGQVNDSIKNQILQREIERKKDEARRQKQVKESE